MGCAPQNFATYTLAVYWVAYMQLVKINYLIRLIISVYCKAEMFGRGKFGESCESSVIRQTKTIQISSYY